MGEDDIYSSQAPAAAPPSATSTLQHRHRHSVVQLGCLTLYLRVLLSGHTFPPPRKPFEMGNSPFKLDFGCKEAEGRVLLRAFPLFICLLCCLDAQVEFCVSKITFLLPLEQHTRSQNVPTEILHANIIYKTFLSRQQSTFSMIHKEKDVRKKKNSWRAAPHPTPFYWNTTFVSQGWKQGTNALLELFFLFFTGTLMAWLTPLSVVPAQLKCSQHGGRWVPVTGRQRGVAHTLLFLREPCTHCQQPFNLSARLA